MDAVAYLGAEDIVPVAAEGPPVYRPGSPKLLARVRTIRTVQELLGHRDVRTTMIYTHVLDRGGLGVVSPVDAVIGPGGAVAPRPPELGRVASRPITQDESSMEMEHRRENKDLPGSEDAVAMRNRPRGSRGERD